jgi:hypothetical protein
MAEKKEVETKKEETKTIVVEALPTQAYNNVELQDGTKAALLTRDEALTEILDIVRQLKRGLI